jgi:flavorubredoxin
MAIVLFDNGTHKCLMFDDLVDDSADHAVQSNQFLIVDNGHGAIIDPGGNMTYNGLRVEMSHHFQPKNLDYILASHADPDIVASLNKWLLNTGCNILISNLWVKFLPHFCTVGSAENRITGIPDQGMNIQLGQATLKAVPAHFMHSEGNFQFYDPVSKILFSGDMGASMVAHSEADIPVEDFHAHIRHMEAFHRRYMVSNKICRFWVNMVRQMDVVAIVPQHGRMFKGKKMVNEFLNWVENLQCGIDLLNQGHYQVPQN